MNCVIFMEIELHQFVFRTALCSFGACIQLIVQESPFSSKNAKSAPDIVQKSPFFFQNAKSRSEIVQKSPFSLQNAKSYPEIVQKSPFSLQNAKPGLDIMHKTHPIRRTHQIRIYIKTALLHRCFLIYFAALFFLPFKVFALSGWQDVTLSSLIRS